ncbi:PTS fructose-like transporter subunit IIB [Serratia entomophila]|uniref:PTS fructose-like transporter subunit IIB n=1 Tax=Serratia entomophila TaxID=42906 RepID=UPI00217C5969|nr:PTS fructose-like transporter subunit IIB [Serratia entomophila]CAI1073947.1 EIIBCA-Man [Serratia entomophila]CAI1738026.1 EIIBCA-Man [Serratia entomophila]CAI1758881.1 EIIBCA-Man [Serratia entomophila]CAI1812824.1 EIIBCA-Man [Serratia entomophila]CAI1857831.1 EIIBCA-Man [Serratia entomophila]
MNLRLVAVTACVSGVAHTYMAAERLDKLCQQEKWSIKIETQGALGIENALSTEDVANADVVLVIADIDIFHSERFEHSRSIQVGISAFLLDPQKVLDTVKRVMFLPVMAQTKLI